MNYVLGYILLIAYLFAFIIGFSSILFSIIYYIIERVAWLRYYIIFLFTFAFLLLIRAVKLLSLLTIPYFMSNNIFNTLYFFSFSVAMSLMLYFIPAFLYRFLNLRWKSKQNIIYIIISITHFILSIIGNHWRLLKKGVMQLHGHFKNSAVGIPGWLIGLAPPSAQGMILESRDRVPYGDPCVEPASPSAWVSASLSLYLCLS